MSLMSKKCVLAMKVEATVGTPISVSASEGTVMVYDAVINPTIPTNPREGQGAFGKEAGVPGPRMGKATFKTDLIGGASAPVWMSTLLAGCGWVLSSLIASPITAPPGTGGVKSLTIARYINGKRRQISGAMGTFKINFVAGVATAIEWEFTGCYTAETDATILTPTYATVLPLRFAGATMTIGGTAIPACRNLTIDAGNTIVPVEDGSTVTGYRNFMVGDRNPKISIDPEAVLVATEDREGIWLASTEQAFSMALGTTGNQMTIAAPKIQLMNVQELDRGGLLANQLEFSCNKSADAGDDELTFTCA